VPVEVIEEVCSVCVGLIEEVGCGCVYVGEGGGMVADLVPRQQDTIIISMDPRI
jgi:hypothetical protein